MLYTGFLNTSYFFDNCLLVVGNLYAPAAICLSYPDGTTFSTTPRLATIVPFKSTILLGIHCVIRFVRASLSKTTWQILWAIAVMKSPTLWLWCDFRPRLELNCFKSGLRRFVALNISMTVFSRVVAWFLSPSWWSDPTSLQYRSQLKIQCDLLLQVKIREIFRGHVHNTFRSRSSSGKICTNTSNSWRSFTAIESLANGSEKVQ